MVLKSCNAPIIKALGATISATYHHPIQQVLKQRKSELEQLHSRYLLEICRNASVGGKQQILQSIARNYLGWKIGTNSLESAAASQPLTNGTRPVNLLFDTTCCP